MKKIKFVAILLALILMLPDICFSATYSLERLFNQPDMEESLNAHLKVYLTKLNRDIDGIFDFRKICIEALKEYLEGKKVKSEIALESFRQFLCTNILLAAIYDKEEVDVDDDIIEASAKSTIELYKKLNKAGLIGGDIDKFMYMYNNALNHFAPRLIRKL